MQSLDWCPANSEPQRPQLEIADIFRAHGDSYRQSHALTPEQGEVMWAIENCRTAALGGHLDKCDACGYARPSYNSCRNRHCSKCQSLAQAEWIDQRKKRILPTRYFHVVFTLPHELNALARRNQRKMYNLLFESASRTLLEFGKSHLGAQIGVTVVLHTWTRDLRFHVHVHCIVTGGGMDVTHNRWVAAKGRYLFPVKALSRCFRGKFLAALARVYNQRKLDLGGNCAELALPDTFHRLKDRLYRKDWVVYAKRPFGGPEQVFDYLGRYTHRVGISNRRLLTMNDAAVTFATKNGKTATVPPHEFIRRFLLHVLPGGFVKIRHYGLMAPANATTKLELARKLLESEHPSPETMLRANNAVDETLPTNKNWRDRLRQLTGVDPSLCPRCHHGTMQHYPLTELARSWNRPLRAPPDSS